MDKLPTGAVRLFATKLFQFIREGAAGFMPTHLAIIFDKSTPRRRSATMLCVALVTRYFGLS